jgi:DNA-binding transcriptional ArsR family regulator
MVVQILSDEEVDRIFQAMADATRRDIVRRVMVSEQSVSHLARDYDMSFAAVQKHVAVLERARLVSKERRGREQLVHPQPEALRQAARLLDAYDDLWRSRISRMDQILTEDRKEEHHDRTEQ